MRGNRHPRVQRALPALVIAVLLLAGCADTARAPSADSAARPGASPRPPPPYVVQSGDTLSTIAAALGIDYLALAEINDLAPPYTIYAGQVLSLAVDELTPQETARIEAARRALIARARADARAAAETGGSSTPGADGAGREPEDPAQGNAAEPGDLPAVTATPPMPGPIASVTTESGSGRWQWPVSGPVVAEYSVTDHKGIDIAGERGTPVHAAADGVVQQVYDQVPNYGRLLIIQHGAQYLGFYAHNARVLVAVGDTVTRGQPIAEMGDSGTDRVKLHFELRRNGRSIDPREVVD